jgi:hypothetical protein
MKKIIPSILFLTLVLSTLVVFARPPISTSKRFTVVAESTTSVLGSC